MVVSFRWAIVPLFGLLLWTNVGLTMEASAPDLPNVFEEALQLYRNQEYSKALGLLRLAHAQEPSNPQICYYLAISLDRMSRSEEAMAQYQYVATHSRVSPMVEYSLSRLRDLQIESVPTTTAELPKRSIIVPLKRDKQALMVEAMLNDQEKSTFILDTGATYTSISKEIADSLGPSLKRIGTVWITTANGRIEVPKVIIERLNVNGLEVHQVEATVIDVRKGSSFSGLLGLSFIKHFKLTIDPEAGQLIFQENEKLSTSSR